MVVDKRRFFEFWKFFEENRKVCLFFFFFNIVFYKVIFLIDINELIKWRKILYDFVFFGYRNYF